MLHDTFSRQDYENGKVNISKVKKGQGGIHWSCCDS